MSLPRWSAALLRLVAPTDRVDDVVGDMEEAHRARVARSGRVRASFYTALETLDMARALLRGDGRQRGPLFSWLDFKLGFRMLVKYPGLTVLGGLAMAFAIWVGTVTFEVATLFAYPTLPLPEGERLVQIESWDVAANGQESRLAHDFLVWRDALESVTELSAWRDVSKNLIVAGGEARPVVVAEMTSSGFRVAGTTPLLGRVLVAADERAGAPPVAVIGYDVWQTRFGGDPQVLGRTAQLGTEEATVVGVMPEGFAFPIAHEVWVPFAPELLDPEPRAGPAVTVFGKLAPGATLESAQAEVATLGRRAASELPATHAHLEPAVKPYASGMMDPGSGEIGIMLAIYLFPVLLLVLVCANVALLMFARAATRESELVVRSALGAGRGRIVAQLFAEALVLGGLAAVVGLGAAQLALRTWGVGFIEVNLDQVPFWLDPSLSPATVVFAAGLTVLGSAIAGVMPALKATRGMGLRLRQAAAGAGGVQFGGVWTLVIVLQVALTTAFPALVWVEQWTLRYIQNFEAGFAAEEYLAARVELDVPVAPDASPEAARLAHEAALASRLAELRRRVEVEPGVAGVTFVNWLPRTEHPQRYIELDGDARAAGERLEATTARVDPSYFDVLGAPILAGRAFQSGDLAPGVHVAIVDQGFVDQVLQGLNPIGQRVRFPGDGDDAPWFEVIGVVRELGMGTPTRKGRAAGFYLPASPEQLAEVQMMVHVRGDPSGMGPRLREIALAVDPTLRVAELQRLDEVMNAMVWFTGLWLRMTVGLTVVAVVLSLAGIYAVLSFTVARRTREIGVRVALGASRRRVVAAIFRRPLFQVALGVLAGGALIFAAGTVAPTTEFAGTENLAGGLSLAQVATLLAYAALMMGVCLLACVVPTRRALGVEPTVALRSE